MRPKVSVVIPVYNRAHSVLPTLKSVQDQTMRDLECIVVDDGSKDGDDLRGLVEGLGDRRFRYVRRDNGGGGAARNTGIDEAKAEIIAFLDSDDRWLPEKLERDLEAGADRQVIFSPMLVERRGRIIGQRPKVAPRPGEPMADYLACRGGFVPTSTIALPSRVAKRIRYDEHIHFGQDTDFALRLASNGIEFRMAGEPTTVMNDDETGARLSRSRDWRAALAWLDRSKPAITKRAFLAYRGSHVARMAAEGGHYTAALRYYAEALLRGALPPPLAAKALVQILVPGPIYRRMRR